MENTILTKKEQAMLDEVHKSMISKLESIYSEPVSKTQSAMHYDAIKSVIAKFGDELEGLSSLDAGDLVLDVESWLADDISMLSAQRDDSEQG